MPSKGNLPSADSEKSTKWGSCLTYGEPDTAGVVALSVWTETTFLNDNQWGTHFLHQRSVNVALSFSSLSNLITSNWGSLLLSVFCLKVFP